MLGRVSSSPWWRLRDMGCRAVCRCFLTNAGLNVTMESDLCIVVFFFNSLEKRLGPLSFHTAAGWEVCVQWWPGGETALCLAVCPRNCLGAQSTWGGMELGFESEGILCPHRQHGGVQGCSCPCHGKVRLGMDGWMDGWAGG